MQTLVYFLVWAGIIFLFMLVGCGRHVMGHGHGGEPRRAGRTPTAGDAGWWPPHEEVDPVCGMTVETARAKSAVHGGRAYYFCSADCRDKFESAPDAYARRAVPSPRTMEHHDHD